MKEQKSAEVIERKGAEIWEAQKSGKRSAYGDSEVVGSFGTGMIAGWHLRGRLRVFLTQRT
jgi:hypothetical protein